MEIRLGGDTLTFEPRAMAFESWRVVESQFVVSTRKLVDSDEEQRLLEELIDGVKPPVPSGAEFEGLHYLLSTPFRHPPLRSGTRFGRATERGVWYGARELETCFAEVAYYRLLFLEGSAARLEPVTVELTAFLTEINCERGVDLTEPPFEAYEAQLTSKVSYGTTHAVGAQLRAAEVEVVLFRAVRTRQRGTNVALFTPAFGSKNPVAGKEQAWVCTTDRQKVELRRKNVMRRGAAETFRYPRQQFEVDGTLVKVDE